MKRGRSLFRNAREEQLLVRATTTIKMSVSDPKRTKAGKTGFKGRVKWEFSIKMLTSEEAQPRPD